MLDYAANAVAYWPAARLKMEFESTSASARQDPNAALETFLAGDMDADQFWERAKTNLEAGRLRLIFVADQIPAELRRIIEFLNQQMNRTEVLGLEIRQFSGVGVRSLVPRVIGQTAEAERLKRPNGSGKQWNEASFFDVLAQRSDGSEQAVARRILDWATARNLRIWWGKGTSEGSFYPLLDRNDRAQYTVAVRTGTKSGYVQSQLPAMIAPFDTDPKRAELLMQLRTELGWALDSSAKYESIRLADLAQGEKTGRLLGILDWILSETDGSS
jgi:hypothetical protein